MSFFSEFTELFSELTELLPELELLEFLSKLSSSISIFWGVMRGGGKRELIDEKSNECTVCEELKLCECDSESELKFLEETESVFCEVELLVKVE
jgi:hypothetical protein